MIVWWQILKDKIYYFIHGKFPVFFVFFLLLYYFYYHYYYLGNAIEVMDYLYTIYLRLRLIIDVLI